jgi:hypothetical protein
MDELDGIQQLPQYDDWVRSLSLFNADQNRIGGNTSTTVGGSRVGSVENAAEMDEFLKGLPDGGGFGWPAFSC